MSVCVNKGDLDTQTMTNDSPLAFYVLSMVVKKKIFV